MLTAQCFLECVHLTNLVRITSPPPSPKREGDSLAFAQVAMVFLPTKPNYSPGGSLSFNLLSSITPAELYRVTFLQRCSPDAQAANNNFKAHPQPKAKSQ